MTSYSSIPTIFWMLTALIFNCSGSDNTDIILTESLTFFTSFDHGFSADFSKGDSNLYIAPSWSRRAEAEPFDSQFSHFLISEAEGRFGNALYIDNSYSPVYFYKGKDNLYYSGSNWEGTLSFWLRLSPDQDLPDGYSDPIQITTRTWNDGALFVDFTDVSPRIFRFAFFADRDVWDPGLREWDDVAVAERPMVEVTERVFTHDEWVHIAFVFSNFNTGRNDGNVSCYINGEFYGSLSGREQTITWDPDEIAIWIGYNYRGYFDELAIFNRVLTPEEIAYIYSLEQGIHQLIQD
jgi:hypothetical protein